MKTFLFSEEVPNAIDPEKPRYASMDMVIAVGFGSAYVYKGKKQIYDGERSDEEKTVADIEEMAKQAPNHDWRIQLYAPLYERIYQRQSDGQWLLIEVGLGFA